MARRPLEAPQPGIDSEGGGGREQGREDPARTQDFDIHPSEIKQWRDQLFEGATGVFGDGLKAEPEPVIDVKTLHAKIGELSGSHCDGSRYYTSARGPQPSSAPPRERRSRARASRAGICRFGTAPPRKDCHC